MSSAVSGLDVGKSLNLKTSREHLELQGEISKKNYEKIEASQPFVGKSFEGTKGIFRVATSDSSRIIFDKSYFKIRLTITNKSEHNVWCNTDIINNLTRSLEVRCQGKTVSSIADY